MKRAETSAPNNKLPMTLPFQQFVRWVTLSSVMTTFMISTPALAQDIRQHSKIPTMSTNLTGFEIPFSVDNPTGKYIEVQLYLSDDKGKSWTFYQNKSVSEKNFKFSCKGDGEYWFAMKTLDRDKQLHPGGKIVIPEMKIIVDTDKPKLDFNIEPDASGRVVARWRATDINIDPSTIQISQRAANGSEQDYQPVAYRPKTNRSGRLYSDQIAWWPESPGLGIDVRFEISDTAGNKVGATRTTQLNQTSIPRRDFSSTTWRKRQHSNSNAGSNRRQMPLSQPNPQVANSKTLNSKPASWLKNAFQQDASRSTPPPAQPRSALANRGLDTADQVAGNSGNAVVWPSKTNKWVQKSQNQAGSTVTENQFPVAQNNPFALRNRYEDIPIRDHKDFPSSNRRAGQQRNKNRSNLVVTESSTMRRGKSGVTVTTKQNHQDHSFVPQTQSWNDHGWNDSNRIQEPAGLADLPEYVAPPAPTDFGIRTPARPVSSPAPVRLKRNLPSNAPSLKANSRRFNLNYDVRSIDPSGVGKVILWTTEDSGQSWRSVAVDPDSRSPFPVQVESEGTYGFKVVINSQDGLTGKPPVSGDPPDVFVDVDWTRPTAQITSAPYGSGKDAGKLIIQYAASDQNLAIRPIRLFYSTQPDGPWTTIEEGLRNSGSYAWKVPSQVPEQIYLRIEARDTANNFGAYQLTSPLDISGLVPRGHIYGVQAISN